MLSSPVVGTFGGTASGDRYFHCSLGSNLISVDIVEEDAFGRFVVVVVVVVVVVGRVCGGRRAWLLGLATLVAGVFGIRGSLPAITSCNRAAGAYL